MEAGPTAERVAANVKQLREARGLRQSDLTDRLTELGHPILSSGIAKIESGERKVTVDDLMALAIALETNPNRLLLSPEGGAVEIELTEESAWSALSAWAWACGELVHAPYVWARFADIEIIRDGVKRTLSAPAMRFQVEARPHDPPLRETREEWERLRPLGGKLDMIAFGLEEDGYTYDDLRKVMRNYLGEIRFLAGDEAES